MNAVHGLMFVKLHRLSWYGWCLCGGWAALSESTKGTDMNALADISVRFKFEHLGAED